MPKGKRVTAADKEKILAVIREVGYQQIGACRAADFAVKSGFSYDSVRKLRGKDAYFERAVQEAQEEFRKSLQGKCENMLVKRALGYDAIEQFHEAVKNGDGVVVTEKVNERKKHIAPDVRALEFILINVSKGVWRDAKNVEVNANIGDRKVLTPDEVKKAEAEIARKYGFDEDE